MIHFLVLTESCTYEVVGFLFVFHDVMVENLGKTSNFLWDSDSFIPFRRRVLLEGEICTPLGFGSGSVVKHGTIDHPRPLPISTGSSEQHEYVVNIL
jgi:hypothetical protein